MGDDFTSITARVRQLGVFQLYQIYVKCQTFCIVQCCINDYSLGTEVNYLK